MSAVDCAILLTICYVMKYVSVGHIWNSEHYLTLGRWECVVVCLCCGTGMDLIPTIVWYVPHQPHSWPGTRLTATPNLRKLFHLLLKCLPPMYLRKFLNCPPYLRTLTVQYCYPSTPYLSNSPYSSSYLQSVILLTSSQQLQQQHIYTNQALPNIV